VSAVMHFAATERLLQTTRSLTAALA